MDIKALQAATREAVKPRFGRKRYLKSRAVPHFPDSLERDYIRLVDAYMKILNSAIAAQLPRIRAALDGMRTDAKEPKDERPGGKPSAAEIAAFSQTMDSVVADMLKEFEYGQGLFDLYGKIKRVSQLGRKLSVAEWRRMVKRTLGIDIMEDYYRGAQFEQLTDRWVADNVALIKTIPQDTLGKMREAVKTGFASGATNKIIAQQIQDAYEVSKSHAKFIARDQTAKLNAQITRQQQEDAGVTEYIWRTTGDSRVRERHRELNGRRFKYSDPPEVDLRTGRRANPGYDFQCRCVALPVFDLDEVVLPWEYAADNTT
jgi:SPP1 gp7 family putative phage head morphogenesis protein